jgi:hypothetical protein
VVDKKTLVIVFMLIVLAGIVIYFLSSKDVFFSSGCQFCDLDMRGGF